MKHVAEYFQELEVRQGYPVETKRVYVATDEPKVQGCDSSFSNGTKFLKKELFSNQMLL